MSERFTTQSIGDVLRFPFQGEEWQRRLGIGWALVLASFLIPVIPALFLYGYFIEVMRGVIETEKPRLPAWEEWDRLAGDGLKAFVVGLVYFFPALVVFIGGFGLYCGSFILLAMLTDPSAAPSAGDDLIGLLFLGGFFLLFFSMAFGFTLSLLGAMPLPMATANLAAQSRLGAAFRLRELYRLMAANPMGYLVAWLVVMGLWSIVYILMLIAYYTLILLCVIPFVMPPLTVYLMLVAAALFGQAYRDSRTMLEESSAKA